MVPAVARALRILDLLSRAPEPLGTSEVARRLKLPKSTTHGLLAELAAAGAVDEVRKRYRIGPFVARVAAVSELRRRWRPALRRLAAEVGETAFLGQQRGARVAVLDEVLGTGAPVVSAPVGSLLPASAGAIGAVLAGAPSAVDLGGYLAGVNAAAVAVPGGVLWVAGFAARLGEERLPATVELLELLAARGARAS